ncbi:MAG: PAS domain-containing protein, partial [Syntrophomonadaceae bacterium]|nr:PAS domain-containing protein [Syntrophomonadaceae bacterium]
ALDEPRRDERQFLQDQEINSLVAVPLRKDGRMIGFVGVDNPRRNQSHVSHLQAIGDYIAVMLTRRDLHAKIASDHKALLGLMHDTPGGFVRMQALPDGSVIPLYVNDGFCNLVRLARDEIMEHYKESALWGVHPDDLPMVQATVDELLATGEARSESFRLLPHDEGDFLWLKFFARMTGDDSGNMFYNVYYTDISEQEKWELSYREMLPVALKTVMSSSSDWLFVKDQNLTYVCCSHAFAEMVGLESEEEIVGKTDYDLFERELADRYRADDLKLMESGQSLVDFVEPIRSEDGTSRFSNTSKYLLHDSSGSVIGLYGNGRDITENLAAYAQLKLLTDSIPGGLAIFELSPPDNIRMTYSSHGFYAITGYTKDEYQELAKDLRSLVFEADIPVIKEHIRSVLQGAASFNFIYRQRGKDGGYRWVNMRGAVSERRGDTVLVNTVKMDITEQMAANEALRIREEEYRLAIAHSGKLIYRYSHADQSVDMPPNTAELLGMPSRLSNVPDSLIRDGAVAPESMDAYIEFYRAMQRGDKTGSMTILRRICDGSYRWFLARFSTVYSDTGAPVSTIVMLEDITVEREKHGIGAGPENRSN